MTLFLEKIMKTYLSFRGGSLSEDEFYITSTEIRDYLFCPVILYNKHVRRIMEPMTVMMKEGKERFEEDRRMGRRRITLLGKRKIKPDKILYAQPVGSKRLGVYGIADVIFWIGKRGYIVEIKDSNLRKAPPDHLYQAVAYALMAEETFNTVIHKVYIYYTRSDTWIERRLSRQIREYTVSIIKRIRRIMSGREIPEIKLKKKCRSCWYNRICHPQITRVQKTKSTRSIIRKMVKDTLHHPLYQRK